MKKTLDTLANALTTPATAQTQEATALEYGTPVTIYIYSFDVKEGYVDVHFNELSGKCRTSVHAKAHPALQVKPHMHKELQAVIDYDDPKGWKMLDPLPTSEQRASYRKATAPKPEPVKVALTAEQIEASKEF